VADNLAYTSVACTSFILACRQRNNREAFLEGIVMKGIAVETVLYAVILVLALALITIIVMRLIPAFGNFINAALSGIKKTICDMLPWIIRWLC